MSSAAKIGLAVILVVVVVVGLGLGGVIPGFHLLSSGNGSSGTSSAGSSANAFDLANAFASSHDSGLLYGVFGISVTAAFQAQLSDINGTCLVHDPTNFTVPADSAVYWNGSASGWLFVYYSSAGPAVNVVGVLGSQAIQIATYPGAACEGAFPSLVPLPATYINSTAAATLAREFSPEISGFVSNTSSANAQYTLAATNNSSAPPVWHLYFTSCSIGPGDHVGSGTSANAFLDAADGSAHPLSSNASASTSCSGGGNPVPGLGETASLGDDWSSFVVSGPTYTEFANLNPPVGVTTGGIGMYLALAATGAPVATTPAPAACAVGTLFAGPNCTGPSGGGWYGVLLNEGTGVILATYDGANAVWSSAGVVVTAVDLLAVISSTDYTSPSGTYYFSPFGTGTTVVVGALAL